jgi:hypothetical protein
MYKKQVSIPPNAECMINSWHNTSYDFNMTSYPYYVRFECLVK